LRLSESKWERVKHLKSLRAFFKCSRLNIAEKHEGMPVPAAEKWLTTNSKVAVEVDAPAFGPDYGFTSEGGKSTAASIAGTRSVGI
jgi:hypothetical protein